MYAFDNLKKGRSSHTWTPADEALADTMSSYWVSFAKDGDPNEEGLPPWPRYAIATDQALELGDEMRVLDALKKERLDLLDRFYESERAAAAGPARRSRSRRRRRRRAAGADASVMARRRRETRCHRQRVTLFYSFRSPYSWLAVRRLQRIRARRRTCDAIAVFPPPGMTPASTSSPRRLAYTRDDATRVAAAYGYTVRWPEALDTEWVRPHGSAYWATEAGPRRRVHARGSRGALRAR